MEILAHALDSLFPSLLALIMFLIIFLLSFKNLKFF